MSNNGYKIAPAHAELTADKLRWRCEASRLPFETTAQAELREGFIGQERALRALKMGVELSAPGYNVFVCGLAGTSRGGTMCGAGCCAFSAGVPRRMRAGREGSVTSFCVRMISSICPRRRL